MSLSQNIKAKAKKWYVQTRNKTASNNAIYPNVKWLSHHIPKTAGTSLYNSLEGAFGRDKILRAYHEYNYAKNLTAGETIWVPKNIKVIHGHFRPHTNHLKLFPNAQRVIWLRDPLETNWSLLNEWLRMTDTPMYKYFYKTYLEGKNYTKVEIFDKMLKDQNFFPRTRIYSSYLKNFKKEDFAFIGNVANYENDLVILGKTMGVPLETFSENVTKEKTKLPVDVEKYKLLLKSEYDLLEEWI